MSSYADRVMSSYVERVMAAVAAERDRARATAVALEQELDVVTRERDEALLELDRLRGNVRVLSEVSNTLAGRPAQHFGW